MADTQTVAATTASAHRGSAGLWARYRSTGDPDARRQLLENNLGLVHYCTNEMAMRLRDRAAFDELLGAATLGLVSAVEGFDPERGLAFSSYATPRIRGAILDELRRQEWRPRRTRARQTELARTRESLSQQLGRAPRPVEVAEAMGIDLPTFYSWSDRTAMQQVPLDAPADRDGARHSLEETLGDPEPTDLFEHLDSADRLLMLREALASLPERERLVLSLSYYENVNLKQIGELLHITESRVSQIRTRALKRLRERIGAREDL